MSLGEPDDGRWHRVGAAGLIAGIATFLLAIPAALAARGLFAAWPSAVGPWPWVGLLAAVAFAVGVGYRREAKPTTTIAGMVAASILLEFRVAFELGDGGGFNPLAYGPPRMAATIVACFVGGLVGARVVQGRSRRSVT